MKPPPNILIVDDDANNLSTFQEIFQREGMTVFAAPHPQQAFDLYRQNRMDVVLCDLRMPSMNGDQLMELCYKVRTGVPFVFLTAYGSIEQAVTLLRSGAYHFLTKPVRKSELVSTVKEALASRTEESVQGTPSLDDPEGLIVGEHPLLRDVLEKARIAAQSQSSILILGESGTGKELLAQMIHRLSPRSERQFVKVNCGAIPDSLMESELFGVVRGAFTGATHDKAGRVELAHQGTLFLDEIGELPLALQVKLLHVLQGGNFERLGESRTRTSDFRLISATQLDLEKSVEAGTFREDLFYRINVIMLLLPPLRSRRDDIPRLVQYYVAHLSHRLKREPAQVTPAAMELLLSHPWPGNIRELRNVLERALVFCGPTLDAAHLHLKTKGSRQAIPQTVTFPVGTPLKEIERRVILDTLEATDYDKELTARLLGTTVRTIYRRFDEWKEKNPS
jgi:two-component system response regulator HydG